MSEYPTWVNIVNVLCEVIKCQSDAIDKLYLDLAQHLTVEEIDRMSVLKDIKHIAKLKESLKGVAT